MLEPKTTHLNIWERAMVACTDYDSLGPNGTNGILNIMKSRLRACMSIGTSFLPIWRAYSASALPSLGRACGGKTAVGRAVFLDMNKWEASHANPLGELTTAPHRIVPYGTGVVEIGVARIILIRFSPAAWNRRRATGDGRRATGDRRGLWIVGSQAPDLQRTWQQTEA